jgi:hypothetical protein
MDWHDRHDIVVTGAAQICNWQIFESHNRSHPIEIPSIQVRASITAKMLPDVLSSMIAVPAAH